MNIVEEYMLPELADLGKKAFKNQLKNVKKMSVIEASPNNDGYYDDTNWMIINFKNVKMDQH